MCAPSKHMFFISYPSHIYKYPQLRLKTGGTGEKYTLFQRIISSRKESRRVEVQTKDGTEKPLYIS